MPMNSCTSAGSVRASRGISWPTLPRWMQYVSHLLPPAYVFEGLRRIVSGARVSGRELVVGGCLALLYIVLARWFFTRIYQHALRTGLIARYSAENLS